MTLKVNILFAGIAFLILFASIQYLLILRHKSPYLSDSYMYKHVFYQMQGDSFAKARSKILTQIDFSKTDDIVKNIFQNESVYKEAHGFFIKRPLYPFLAAVINSVIKNEYLAFLLPVFLAYLGLIILCFYFTNITLGNYFSIYATSLFISFYPLLDWSTYFLTDTIGAFFYFLQLVFIYKYLKEGKTNNLIFFSFSLFISLLSREQSVLMLPLLTFSFLLCLFFNQDVTVRKRHARLISISLSAALIYILVSAVTNQKNIIDTIVYTMNSYGLYQNQFDFPQIFLYVIATALKSHIDFVKDLVPHHWWLVFVLLAAVQSFKIFIIEKKPRLLDILIVSSALASYISIFIYPVLSYRFFYPVVVAIVYFSTIFTKDFARRIDARNLSRQNGKL